MYHQVSNKLPQKIKKICKKITLEQVKPFPIAASRKNTIKRKILGKIRVLTDTPEKLALEEEYQKRKKILAAK